MVQKRFWCREDSGENMGQIESQIFGTSGTGDSGENMGQLESLGEAVGQTGGQTHALGRHASTLFDEFGFWIFLFLPVWDVMRNP